MISYIFGLYRFEQIAEIVLLPSSHLQNFLKILHRTTLHKHLIPLRKLLIRQLHQLDNIFRLGEALIDEAHIVRKVLLVSIRS